MAGKQRCVIVDDDADFRGLLAAWLDRFRPNLEVVWFASAHEALDYLIRYGAHLLLTDFKMPAMDGLELTRRVRELDAQMPIVVMSGDEIEAAALAQGANAFLPKRQLSRRLAAMVDRFHSSTSAVAAQKA